VTQLALAASGATVTVTGGPWSISQTLTTGASGQVTFPAVPGGTGYTVTATKGSDTANVTTSVTAGSTTTANVALPNPPAGSVQATVQWLGSNVTGATVFLTGGPYGINVSGTTTGTGVVTFTSVPAGSGYTLYATKNGQQSPNYSPTVTVSTTTPVTVAMPTATLTVTTTWASVGAGSASVSVSGGPNGGTYSGTANASGVATVTVPTTTTNNYTVSSSKAGGTGSSTVTTVPAGGAATTVTLTPTKVIAVTIKRANVNAPSTGISLSVTGGPNGTVGAAPAYTVSGTTNGSAVINITVPTGAGTYTIKANLSTCGASGSNRSGSVALISAAAATLTATVNMTTTACPFSPLP